MEAEYPGSEFVVPTSPEEVAKYRCWFDFLKNCKDEWTDEVLVDFGDISNTTFEDWWPDHKQLFRQHAYLSPIEVLSPLDTVSRFKLDNENYEDADGGCAVIGIRLYYTKDEIKAAFAEWLKKAHSGKRGVRKRFTDEMVILYGLDRDTDVKMLEKVLRVYLELKTEETKPTKNQRSYIQIENYLKLINRDDGPPLSYTQTETVAEYKRIADEIMTNVAKGKFPVYTVRKSKN